MMHTLVTKTEAIRLHDRVCASMTPVAVFVKNKTYRATKISTNLFKESMDKGKANELMGVYDHECRLEWLEDDLADMGVK